MRLRDGDRCRSHDAVIRVYDEAGNVSETQEHTGHFKERRAKLDSFTDRSEPFAVQLCSIPVRHGTDLLWPAVHSLFAGLQ